MSYITIAGVWSLFERLRGSVLIWPVVLAYRPALYSRKDTGGSPRIRDNKVWGTVWRDSDCHMRRLDFD